jgi:hypothetical protein
VIGLVGDGTGVLTGVIFGAGVGVVTLPLIATDLITCPVALSVVEDMVFPAFVPMVYKIVVVVVLVFGSGTASMYAPWARLSAFDR